MSIGFKRFKEVGKVVAGQHIASALYNDDPSGTPYLTGPADFGHERPTVTKWTSSPKIMATETDVLITVKGNGVGKSNLGVNAAIGRQLMALRPNPTLLDQKYLYRFIVASQARINALGQGATVPGIGKDDIDGLQIPLPPLSEQKRIAEILDRAEALRSQRRAALALLDELTQSIFLDMFGDPIENPRDFQVKKMIEIVDPNRPISYGILKPGPDQERDGIPYIRVVDMKDGGIDESAIRSTTKDICHTFRRSILRPGDLLLSIRGHVGRCALVPESLAGANITQDTARLAIVDNVNLYVMECLRTISFQRWMARHTKGVAVRGINLADVKVMPIPIPPEAQQMLFAKRIEHLAKLRLEAKRFDSDSCEFFASLQHRAFRGEL